VCTLAIVPSVESERWNCLDCLLKVRVQLHIELFKGCGCASRKRSKLSPPLLLVGAVLRTFAVPGLNLWYALPLVSSL
jgi:hypothetical protein